MIFEYKILKTEKYFHCICFISAPRKQKHISNFLCNLSPSDKKLHLESLLSYLFRNVKCYGCSASGSEAEAQELHKAYWCIPCSSPGLSSISIRLFLPACFKHLHASVCSLTCNWTVGCLQTEAHHFCVRM